MYSLTHILLGLTAAERWAAARRIGPRSASQQWFVMIGVALLLVLLVLLVAISYRRHQQSKGQKAEEFDLPPCGGGSPPANARFIEAIAARSGLRRTSDIFHKVDAFDRGRFNCWRNLPRPGRRRRLPIESGESRRLRQKLGIRPATAGRGRPGRSRPSSRDIPVGKFLDLTGRREDQAVALRVEILRNDEIELAVALRTPLGSKPGDSWLARYYAGLSAWEFRTSTVSCDERRWSSATARTFIS